MVEEPFNSIGSSRKKFLTPNGQQAGKGAWEGQAHGNLYLAAGKNAEFCSVGVLERRQEIKKVIISMGCCGVCVQVST